MKKRNVLSQMKYWISAAAIVMIFGLAIQFVRAWTEPTSAPPTGNVGAPLTTGALGQSKSGNMFISTIDGVANGLIVAFGKVGIGTWDPGAKLEVAGQVKITDGLQGAGKVLTSDADGLASWQSAGTSILQQVYPVGSIYTSVSSTNPNTLFGFGTWVAFGSGRSLVGFNSGDSDFNTVEKQIGEKNHTLTQAEMPSHYHTVDPPNTGTSYTDTSHNHTGATGYMNQNWNHSHSTPSDAWMNASGAGATDQLSSSNINAALRGSNTGGTDTNHTHNFTTDMAWFGHTHAVDIGQFNSGSVGSGTAFNNIQPSIVVYFFKRTN